MKRTEMGQENSCGRLVPETSRNDSQLIKIEGALEGLWRRPGFLLRRCIQHTSGVFEQSCAELGLTARQYDYLFVLDIVDEIGQGEIGEVLGLDKSTNTLVLKILERKKWVVRKVVEADNRRRIVGITTEGRGAFKSARLAADKAHACIEGAVTDSEYRSLVAILQKIVAANTGLSLVAEGSTAR